MFKNFQASVSGWSLNSRQLPGVRLTKKILATQISASLEKQVLEINPRSSTIAMVKRKVGALEKVDADL